MTTETEPLECPRCHKPAAVKHCRNESPCVWRVCRSCKATTDPERGRGYDSRSTFALEP